MNAVYSDETKIRCRTSRRRTRVIWTATLKVRGTPPLILFDIVVTRLDKSQLSVRLRRAGPGHNSELVIFTFPMRYKNRFT